MRRRTATKKRGRRGPARQRKRASSSIRKALVKTFAMLVVTLGLVTVGAVALFRYVDPPITAMMLQQPVPLRSQRHVWVPREAVAPAFAHAVIASEDQLFMSHRGFDFGSIEKAVRDYRAGGTLRGASTITQQVAKNMFLWPGRSFVRKGIEVYFTLLIEALWPKERILEVYVNVAELGEGVFGVEAAAQAYFGIDAQRLGDEQAAVLAAVLPNPKRLRADRPSEYVERRRDWILGQMRRLRANGHYRELDW